MTFTTVYWICAVIGIIGGGIVDRHDPFIPSLLFTAALLCFAVLIRGLLGLAGLMPPLAG